MERVRLLVTDLDGTLLGDVEALAKFCAWRRAVGSRLRLVYSSGRFLDSVLESIEAWALPAPDAIICGVGTEIFELPARRRVEGWPCLRGGWDPAVVMTTCLARGELELQPKEFLSNFKISFYGYDLDNAFLTRLSQALAAAGQCTTIIYSSNRDLDILPAGTHKGSAAAHLARMWRLNSRDVVVAGDSGNDLSMFHEGFCGVIVANAQPELRLCAAPNVYHAKRSFAAGIVEGVRHWWSDASDRVLQSID